MNVAIPTEMKYVQYIKYRHAAAIFNRTTNLFPQTLIPQTRLWDKLKAGMVKKYN